MCTHTHMFALAHCTFRMYASDEHILNVSTGIDAMAPVRCVNVLREHPKVLKSTAHIANNSALL